MIQYKTEKLFPWLYRIHDPLNVYFYLIVGHNKALLFDTGHGVGNIPETIKAITTKPYTVVLGHGHIDHANGAYQFDEVYLHEGDFELSRLHCSPEFRGGVADDIEKKGLQLDADPAVWREAGSGNLKKLNPGTVFDLGGLHVEVVDMAGHTAGSIGLLVTEKRVLLNSDSANSHSWMFLEETLPIPQYIAMLERVMELEFDVFYTAHNEEPFPKSDFLRYIRVAKNASIEKAEPYPVFPELKPHMYTEDGVSIVFSERTLHG
ncbi:MAG: MBL fold metallo-hydrolase [Clostridia bacterium]|nr:MBL fold metallo-hydrolase [Clostridia bacterium]